MPEVFVTGPDGRKYTADVEGVDKVERLREQVSEQAGIPVEKVRLFLERQKVVIEELRDDQTCGQVGLKRHTELSAGFAVDGAPEHTAAQTAMADFSRMLANITRVHARCAEGMAELEKKEQALEQRKVALQQRNREHMKIKDKIQINTGTVKISTRRSVLQFFPRTRLAALFSGCYDSEFIMHDGLPFLDTAFECLRELVTFLTRCKKASDAGEPLPPLPAGPLGLEDEMAAMLCNFGITMAFEAHQAGERASGGRLPEGQPPTPVVAGDGGAAEPEPQAEAGEADWLAYDIKATAADLEVAMSRHRAELLVANERHVQMVEEFEAEQQWVRGYVRSTKAPELSEVIELEVGGVPVATTRRVLTLCPESVLAQRFAAPPGGRGVGDGGGESGSSSSDDEAKGEAVVIEEDPQCFLKMLGRLRMRTVLGAEEAMPALSIAPDKEAMFREVVSLYFPGQETFIMGDEFVGGVDAEGGNALVALGGGDGSGHLSSCEVYDPQADRWEAIASMGSKRHYAGATVLGGRLYALGGYDGSVYLSSCEVYDPQADRWEAIASMGSKRHGVGATVLGGRLYALGGYDGSGHLSSCEVYDPEADRWEAIASMGSKRHGVGATVLGGRLYALGGYDGSGHLSSCEVYDPEADRWEAIASMGSKRHYAGATVLGGRLYALGGYDGSVYLSSCEVYDPQADRWEAIASMGSKRHGVGATVLGGRLYALGGRDGSGHLSSCEVYDPEADRWEAIASMGSKRQGVGATTLQRVV